MRGNVTVHETQSDFDEWMSKTIAEQNRSQLAVAAGPQGR
jgi:cytochrome c oxidase subunit 2